LLTLKTQYQNANIERILYQDKSIKSH